MNIGRLDSSNEATLMQVYIWGLHRDIVEQVSIMHPTSLSQAIASAKEIELAVKFSCRPPVRHSGNSSQRRSGSQGVTYSHGNPKDRWRQRRGGRSGGQQNQHPSDPRPQQTCTVNINRKIQALKAKFVVTNVDRWCIFV